MTEDSIKNLLRGADRMAGRPGPVFVDIHIVRRRARRRRFVSAAVPAAAAAVVLITICIWSLTTRTHGTRPEQPKIASLEDQIKLLQARADATLRLVREVLENQRRQSELDRLEANLARMRDPLEEIRQQVDNTAFILVYQADRMYRELNLKDSAVQTYNRVIELFPDSRWAEVARQRLSEIQNRKSNKVGSEGDLIWRAQSALLSCLSLSC